MHIVESIIQVLIGFFPLKAVDRLMENFGFRPLDRPARLFLAGGQIQALKSFGYFFATKYLPAAVSRRLFEIFGGGVFNRLYRYDS